MNRRLVVVGLCCALLAAAPALAGSPGKKCEYSTQHCLDYMANRMKNAGFVGVELDQNAETGALTVTRVIPGTPAEAAGIQPEDVLFALNGVEINDRNKEKLEKARKDWVPGKTVTYTIKRGGAAREVTLTLAPFPADVYMKMVGEHMLEHATPAGDLAEKKSK